MKILDVVQGTEAWKAARLGVVTASEIDALVSPEWKVRTGDGPRSYLCAKVAEKLLGYASEGGSWATDQGVLLEKTAIPWYEFLHDVQVQRVGFCISDDGYYGCSPDGLLGDEGGLELKCPQGENHVRNLIMGEVPKQYRAQVQFSMFVTGRRWWKFVSYNSFLPKLVLHVEADPAAHAAFRTALDAFIPQYATALARVQSLMPQGRAA